MCISPHHSCGPIVKTITSFHHLHPLAKVDLFLFVDDFHLEMDLVLDREAFIFVLMHSPRLSSDGSSNMVYEFLQDFFVPDDFARCGFNIFFEICGHIVCGHVALTISHIFVTSQLLVLEK